LKTKSNLICFHYIRECVAMGEAMIAHIWSEDNPADICTKLMLAGGEKRNRIVSNILYYYDNENEVVLDNKVWGQEIVDVPLG
jgi:hypothetical protein